MVFGPGRSAWGWPTGVARHAANRHHRQFAHQHGPSIADRAYRQALRDTAPQFNRFSRSPMQLAWQARLETLKKTHMETRYSPAPNASN